jgi:hypothetical protein
VSEFDDCCDKYIAWFHRQGARVCLEIYRCNQTGKTINFGKLYAQFKALYTEKELSGLLQSMEDKGVIDDEWRLENGIWERNVFITQSYVSDLQKLNKLPWD